MTVPLVILGIWSVAAVLVSLVVGPVLGLRSDDSLECLVPRPDSPTLSRRRPI
jgi:hypothetical protein